MLFYELTNHLCLPVILVRTSKWFSMSCKMLRVLKDIFPVYSQRNLLVNWVCSAYNKLCSDSPPLDLYCYVKIKLFKTISPIKMFHMVDITVGLSSHQVPFHGKEVLEITYSLLVK